MRVYELDKYASFTRPEVIAELWYVFPEIIERYLRENFSNPLAYSMANDSVKHGIFWIRGELIDTNHSLFYLKKSNYLSSKNLSKHIEIEARIVTLTKLRDSCLKLILLVTDENEAKHHKLLKDIVEDIVKKEALTI